MDLSDKLFFDIETHRVENFDQKSDAIKNAFISKIYNKEKYESPEEHFNAVSCLHPELSHVICVCFGYEGRNGEFRESKLFNLNEKQLLTTVKVILDQFESSGFKLAGHNIIGFDIPYLAKRYIINKMEVPHILNNAGRKPWEVEALDTMLYYRMGSSNNTSLDMICAAMDIPCKTTQINGRNLHEYDINEINPDELMDYCSEDVRSNYSFIKEVLDYLK